MTCESYKRCLLHINKLDNFKNYLTDSEIEYRPGKGLYQIMQIKIDKIWCCIFLKDETKEHYSLDKRLVPLVTKFLQQNIKEK